MIEIPIETNGGAYTTLSCNVGENSVSMRLLWNERDAHWYCDFESSDGKNNGVRLVENSLLLRNDNRVSPGGDFVILKQETSSDLKLGFDSLGNVFKMYFLNSEDLQIFKGLL